MLIQGARTVEMRRPYAHAAVVMLSVSILCCVPAVQGAAAYAQKGRAECVYANPDTGHARFVESTFTPAIPSSKNPLKILTFGDSVVWGNGEKTEHKFVSLAAQAIADEENTNVTVHAYAHSGARLAYFDAEDEDVFLPVNADGTPMGDLDAERPTVQDQEICATKEDPDADFVLIDGCINEVGATKIALPILPFVNGTTPKQIREDVYKYCSENMLDTLNDVKQHFPKAKIVLLDYYRIVSGASNPLGVHTDLDGKHQDLAKEHEIELEEEVRYADCMNGEALNCSHPADIEKRVQAWQDNSAEFLNDTEACFRWAVTCSNDPGNSCKLPPLPPWSQKRDQQTPPCPSVSSSLGRPIVVLAKVPDNPDYSYGAPQKHLWSLPIAGLREDEMYDDRKDLCKHKLKGDSGCMVNVTAHPNLEGAEAYRDAIIDAIYRAWGR
jgi:lysophospholipase L1-like esterase